MIIDVAVTETLKSLKITLQEPEKVTPVAELTLRPASRVRCTIEALS